MPSALRKSPFGCSAKSAIDPPVSMAAMPAASVVRVVCQVVAQPRPKSPV